MSRLPEVIRLWIFFLALMVVTFGFLLGRLQIGSSWTAFILMMLTALGLAAFIGRKVVLLDWGEVITGLVVVFVVNGMFGLFAQT